MSEYQKNCSRCGVELKVWTMSKFNTDIICMSCKEDERQAPGYKAADEAELQAVKNGVRNFPGVGLSDEDKKFLAERRAQRTTSQTP